MRKVKRGKRERTLLLLQALGRAPHSLSRVCRLALGNGEDPTGEEVAKAGEGVGEEGGEVGNGGGGRKGDGERGGGACYGSGRGEGDGGGSCAEKGRGGEEGGGALEEGLAGCSEGRECDGGHTGLLAEVCGRGEGEEMKLAKEEKGEQ